MLFSNASNINESLLFSKRYSYFVCNTKNSYFVCKTKIVSYKTDKHKKKNKSLLLTYSPILFARQTSFPTKQINIKKIKKNKITPINKFLLFCLQHK